METSSPTVRPIRNRSLSRKKCPPETPESAGQGGKRRHHPYLRILARTRADANLIFHVISRRKNSLATLSKKGYQYRGGSKVTMQPSHVFVPRASIALGIVVSLLTAIGHAEPASRPTSLPSDSAQSPPPTAPLPPGMTRIFDGLSLDGWIANPRYFPALS